MGFQLSPGVVTSEIDLTTVVPAVATSTGGFAGKFRWGPCEWPTTITTELDLVQKFGEPDSNTANAFFTCSNFLSYAGDLRVVRAVNSGSSNNSVSTAANGTPSGAVTIKSDADFFDSYENYNSYGPWIARYPGAIGDSLQVCAFDSTTNYSSWTYQDRFPTEPGTSNYFSKYNASGRDEFHMVIVDEDGLFTGVKGTVLETFGYVSKCSDAKDESGNSIYYRDVINKRSKYIWASKLAPTGCTDWGTAAVNQLTAFTTLTSNPVHWSLAKGNDGSVGDTQLTTAFNVFNNTEYVDISLLMTGDAGASPQGTAIDVATTRLDCITFVSPPLSNVQSGVTSVVNYRNNTLNKSTSYAFMDSGWKYQYDKYNDVYRWVPLNGDIAGLCARTDSVRDPWFSPAGINRGQIKNVIKLALNPKQSERDTLYKNGVNPVVSFPGEGIILFGDKTLLNRPSAFDRINVRRLFITLEKAIAKAARSQLFEFNDEFTRAQFVSIVEPYLRDVKGRRGVYDYKVVCDKTNNTAQVIDSNQFVGDIYIKPARSINFIQLNFVAVRTGVSFDEIVGKF